MFACYVILCRSAATTHSSVFLRCLLQLWNAFDVPVLLHYVVPLDPRYVMLYATENMTIGPYDRFPDLIVNVLSVMTLSDETWTWSVDEQSLASLEYDANTDTSRP